MAETVVYTPENGGANSMLPWLTAMSQKSGIDANTLLALSNGGFGGFGGGNGILWLFFLWMMWQNGGFNGNGAGLANMINNNEGRDYLAQAIAGNHEAINNLANMLNTNIASVQSTLNSISLGIQQVGNQVGMSGLQTINAIQSGNCDLANKLASCCCETRQAITTQGFENRLATLQQTDAINAKIAEQTTMINDKFCDLEKRELQARIDALAQQNTILRGTIDNANQTAAIQAYVGQTVAPVTAQLAALGKEVDDIKCKLPATVNVPYPNIVAMSQGTAWNLLTGGGYGGYGYGGGFFGQGI